MTASSSAYTLRVPGWIARLVVCAAYTLKRSGARTLPWGRPFLCDRHLPTTLFTLWFMLRPLKWLVFWYLKKQLLTISYDPYHTKLLALRCNFSNYLHNMVPGPKYRSNNTMCKPDCFTYWGWILAFECGAVIARTQRREDRHRHRANNLL